MRGCTGSSVTVVVLAVVVLSVCGVHAMMWGRTPAPNISPIGLSFTAMCKGVVVFAPIPNPTQQINFVRRLLPRLMYGISPIPDLICV